MTYILFREHFHLFHGLFFFSLLLKRNQFEHAVTSRGVYICIFIFSVWKESSVVPCILFQYCHDWPYLGRAFWSCLKTECHCHHSSAPCPEGPAPDTPTLRQVLQEGKEGMPLTSLRAWGLRKAVEVKGEQANRTPGPISVLTSLLPSE